MLRDVAAWQERHGYPLMFATEASIDLADDAELMELMTAANISSAVSYTHLTLPTTERV